MEATVTWTSLWSPKMDRGMLPQLTLWQWVCSLKGKCLEGKKQRGGKAMEKDTAGENCSSLMAFPLVGSQCSSG